MKICNETGCTYFVFSGDKCKYHQFKRHLRGGDLYKPRKKKNKIPKESVKRKHENKTYREQIKDFWDESVAKSDNYCFFCGKEMNKRDNIHHLKGRTGDYLLDKQWWVNAHNQCHVDDYTMATVEQLMKQPWYNGFLKRILAKSKELYQKELKKQDKAQLDFDTEDTADNF